MVSNLFAGFPLGERYFLTLFIYLEIENYGKFRVFTIRGHYIYTVTTKCTLITQYPYETEN